MTHTTVQQILTIESGMRKICAKIVPKNLSQEQKDVRRERCLDDLQSIDNDPLFPERVVTGDESCIFEYNPEIKCPSMEWHISTSLWPKKARMGVAVARSLSLVII